MIGAEERRIPEGFRGRGDGELVGVGGALLRFDEYAEVHSGQSRRDIRVVARWWAPR